MTEPFQQADAELFQSTPSARRATAFEQIYRECVTISIHALREEGDPDMVKHNVPNCG